MQLGSWQGEATDIKYRFSSDLGGWADRFFMIILSTILLISILTLVDGQTLVREREGKVETPLPPFDRSPPAWST